MSLGGPHLALVYEYVEDVLERRGPYREAHLEQGRKAKADGLLVAGGALGDPPTGALFVFAGADRAAVEDYAARDPYVTAGVVSAWRVEPWNVVL